MTFRLLSLLFLAYVEVVAFSRIEGALNRQLGLVLLLGSFALGAVVVLSIFEMAAHLPGHEVRK